MYGSQDLHLKIFLIGIIKFNLNEFHFGKFDLEYE